MTVFTCAGCGASLTVPVSQVALPVHARQHYGHELIGTLMERGTYAVDPDPFGPPFRRWEDIGEREAQARGWYVPVPALSEGPRDTIVLAPDDVRGTVFIPGHLDGYCCGLDGRDGPNLACEGCGLPVATRLDDCSLWQAVHLDPRTTRRAPGDATTDAPIAWEDLREIRPGLALVESQGYWHPVWEAAVASALAHVLAASNGTRVIIPDGHVAEVFRRTLDGLLRPGTAPKTLGLVGPGTPDVTTDIAVVPRHPQTGRVWDPPTGTAAVVPLEWDVWASLALHHDRGPIGGSGSLLRPFHLGPDEIRCWRS